jgi:flavin-dependent dehydrogenase
MDQNISNEKKAAGRAAAADGNHSLKDHYLEQLKLVPNLRNLLGGASLKDTLVKSASDYSYSADRYAGDHYRLIGDAAGQFYNY